MIIGFIGKMGSGKTISMTREAFKYHLKGYSVISNFHLNFPHQEIEFEKLYEMAEAQEQLENVVILLDEIHIILDSRSGMSKTSKVMSFWLNQTRKMRVKMFYTTQYLHQIDKRLRSGTDLFVFCDGLTVNKNGKKYFICCNEISMEDKVKKEIFIGNDFFELYDTNQVIKFIRKKEGGTIIDDEPPQEEGAEI